jgi:conjugative transfer pilus assembly protein TraH
MRARVGDVMRWDANDKVPLFSAIPPARARIPRAPMIS